MGLDVNGIIANIVASIGGDSLIGRDSIIAKKDTTSGVVINPNSNIQKLTSEEKQIYELGEAEIQKLCEEYKERNKLSFLDMGTIGEIRNNYEIGHPEYAKVLKKLSGPASDASDPINKNYSINTDS